MFVHFLTANFHFDFADVQQGVEHFVDLANFLCENLDRDNLPVYC